MPFKLQLIKTEILYLQFLISDIKTARPRIPSPLVAGMIAKYCVDDTGKTKIIHICEHHKLKLTTQQ